MDGPNGLGATRSPSSWSHSLAILDIKDCFLHIPLAPQDWGHFAFPVWKPNMHKPVKNYQWVVSHKEWKIVLIGQLCVAQTLVSVPKDVVLVYYMGDSLLTHSDTVYLQKLLN